MATKINKKIIGYLWLIILLASLLAYVLFPQTFNLTNLIAIIKNHYWLAVIIYSLVICLRGLLFISPLSIALASSVFFPPLTVFLVNSLGIIISSTLIYKFSQFLGFDQYFEKKYQKRISKIKRGLDKKEIPIIIIWSFLPLFPTDLITYVSATLKIPIWKCLLGVFIGTAIINALFISSLNFFLPAANIPSTKPNQIASSSTKLAASPLALQSKLTPPLTDARQRVTKKPFGLKISPTNSPVKPERFSGYHTGVDFEIRTEEANQEVVVSAICSGPLILKKYAAGYGGVAVQKCTLDQQTVTIIYGHLKLTSIKRLVGAELTAGETLASLGQGESPETDGERKHLHLGIHQGETINLLGYVNNPQDLSAWLNPLDYLP